MQPFLFDIFLKNFIFYNITLTSPIQRVYQKFLVFFEESDLTKKKIYFFCSTKNNLLISINIIKLNLLKEFLIII